MRSPVNFTAKTWWTVLAPSELGGGFATQTPCYPWMATGPCGCHCGVELTPQAAEQKARAASLVLADYDEISRKAAR